MFFDLFYCWEAVEDRSSPVSSLMGVELSRI
jgi:hypothetical protein